MQCFHGGITGGTGTKFRIIDFFSTKSEVTHKSALLAFSVYAEENKIKRINLNLFRHLTPHFSHKVKGIYFWLLAIFERTKYTKIDMEFKNQQDNLSAAKGMVINMKRLFLVEDDKEIAKNLTLLLRTEGFTVTHAATQREAIAELAENVFDIALVDISLPDGNGFSVCTEIKQAQGIPVIFLTASGDEASVVTGLNIGAEDYITKPFRSRELIARIEAALRKTGHSPTAFDIGDFHVDTASSIVKKATRKFSCLRWNIAFCLFLLAIPKAYSPGSACWMNCGMPQANS